MLSFKVRCDKIQDYLKVDQIAKDLQLKIEGSSLEKNCRFIHCFTLDEFLASREIFKEAGFQTHRMR